MKKYEWYDNKEITLHRNLTIKVDEGLILPNEIAKYLNVPMETTLDHMQSPDFPTPKVLNIIFYYDYELEEYKRKINN